jgi:hypothetical protein
LNIATQKCMVGVGLKGGETLMRPLIAMAASLAMVMAQVPLAPARADTAPPAPQVVSESSVIAQTFQAYPNGGDALTKDIRALILSNPKLAPDLVLYMRNAQGLSRAQRLAAEQALAEAANRLGIKAAERPVPPVVTKEGIVAPPPDESLWLIALGLLAVGAAACIAACSTSSNTPLNPTVH